VCDLRFSELRTFNRYLKRHDPALQKRIRKKSQPGPTYSERSPRKETICPHCGTGFSLCCKSNFKNHVLQHVRPDSEKQKHRCTYEGCIKEYHTLTSLKNHIDSKHREVRPRCDIDGCGATFTTTSGWQHHCHVEHEGVEMAELIRSKASQRTIQYYANMSAKAEKGLCSVSASCPNKGVVHGKVLIPACEIHRQSWLRNKLRQSRCRIDWENRASRRSRKGWGEGINNPDEMAACLPIVPVPSVIADLVRKIGQVNRTGDDLFFTDFEFVLIPERRDIAGMTAWHFSVEIAVVRLDG